MIENKQQKMVDKMGKYRTQSLFLEIGYGDDAIFTLKDQDHVHDGKTYLSLRKMYLEFNDPTEYQFANEVLLGWKHWQRLCENKAVRKYIDEWREELEVKLRSQAILNTIREANKGHFQAAKWVADRGWASRGAGRPSKEEIERNSRISERINNEFEADIIRLVK